MSVTPAMQDWSPSGWPDGPQRIVCLTEETTEWLYMLGQEHRIVGISGYTVRPRRARDEKPKVSAFLSAKIDKILALKPDCVIGFSDLQADIASQLIKAGVQVVIFNQRSVDDICQVLLQVAAMVGCEQQGKVLLRDMREQLAAMRKAAHRLLAAKGLAAPVIYFEEWDEPPISAIRWVSELIALAGGRDCFAELGAEPLGKDRIIADSAEIVRRQPDIVVGSWCSKKFRPEKVAARLGWADVPAVRSGHLYEIKSADILQPGPAALTDGARQLHQIVVQWAESTSKSASIGSARRQT